MPLTEQDIGKRAIFRSPDGRWNRIGDNDRIAGFNYEPHSHIYGGLTAVIDPDYVRVRFTNGSVWTMEASRVRVIDETPAESQPPCLPGTCADTEAQDH